MNSTAIQLLMRNTLTQIAVLAGIMIVSSILSIYFEWAYYVTVSAISLLSAIAAIYILHAWVINPIRNLMKRKNEKN